MCRGSGIQIVIPCVANRIGHQHGNVVGANMRDTQRHALGVLNTRSLLTLVYLRKQRTHGGKRFLTASIVGELQQEFAGKADQAGPRPE